MQLQKINIRLAKLRVYISQCAVQLFQNYNNVVKMQRLHRKNEYTSFIRLIKTPITSDRLEFNQLREHSEIDAKKINVVINVK